MFRELVLDLIDVAGEIDRDDLLARIRDLGEPVDPFGLRLLLWELEDRGSIASRFEGRRRFYRIALAGRLQLAGIPAGCQL